MPEIITAKTAGFCFGVKRAVEIVRNETRDSSGSGKRKIYTYGPIVHNDDVVNEFASLGVEVIEEADIDRLDGGTVIVRAHGISRRIFEKLKSRNLNVIDATCPFVARIHKIVRESKYPVIILGDPNHPEVEGIRGWSKDAVVVRSAEEFVSLGLSKDTRYTLVAQTTFNYEKFEEIIVIFKQLKYDIICFNTVCNATQERQKEAAGIASYVDTMIVIGGKNSSNTRKLYEICRAHCKATELIQRVDDLNGKDLSSVEKVGITAGASTPNNIIEEVQTYVRS